MGTSTRTNILDALSQRIGDYFSGTTSSAGNGGGTTLIDTDLTNLTEDDDGIQGWLRPTSGSASGEIRRILSNSGYTASTGTVTVNFAFSAQIANTVTFELHRYDPNDKFFAIEQALRDLFPQGARRRGLYRQIIDETITVGNQLANAQFETFAGGSFTSWAEVGSPTVSAETTIVRHGTNSAKAIAGGSDGQFTQAPTINVNDLTDTQVTLAGWVYATAADTARIRLDWDGSDIENHAYHSGEDDWEKQKLTFVVPSTATQVKAICEVVAGGTAYFDQMWLLAGPVHRVAIPTSIVNGPHRILQQHSEDHVEGPFYEVGPNDHFEGGKLLRLQGMGVLSQPSTDSGTTEVDGARLYLVAERAAENLFKTLAARSDGDDRRKFQEQAAEHAAAVDTMLLSPGMAMPRMAAQQPDNNWHVQDEAGTRYLMFNHRPTNT
jgi:hypothetical protein